MVVEVKYQTKRDATAEYTDFTQTEYFETDTIPDKPTIVRKLLAMVNLEPPRISSADWISSLSFVIQVQRRRLNLELRSFW